MPYGRLWKLRREKAEIEERLAPLLLVVSAYEASLGKRPRKPAMGSDGLPVEKIKRGQVVEHIDAVLTSGGDYTEPDLRRMIAQRFNIVYGRSAVYTALRRGLNIKYEKKEKRWRMKVT